MKIFHFVLFFILRLFFIKSLVNSQSIQTNIENIAQLFEAAFNNIFKVLNATSLASTVSNYTVIQINDTTATNILSDSKLNTENLVKKANSVVNRTQSNLTTTYSQYVSSGNFVLDCFNKTFITYYRAKAIINNTYPIITNCSNQALPFSVDPIVNNLLTNRNSATTHVPTTVYDSSGDAQNFANWTRNLDTLFLLTQYDSQIKWQYFCHSSGYFKIFPGIRWNIQTNDSISNSSLIDYFDCRSEHFYLQSTTYPKKVFIMVDQSGSMAGRSVVMAYKIVYEILNTLTENDYFNIGLFGVNLTIVDRNITKTFVQANERNKQYFLGHLKSNHNPNFETNFNLCLTEVFKYFRNDKINQTPNYFYNYLIMIVTDGSFSYVENISENDVNARILVHFTQQAAQERVTITTLACTNNGFAVESHSLSDVKENVQSYLNVVARKNAIMQNVFTVWSGVHKMQMQPSEASAFQNSSSTSTVVTTSLAPIFTSTTFSSIKIIVLQSFSIQVSVNKRIEMFVAIASAVYDQRPITIKQNSGILLGSVGVDVSTNEFVKTAPFWKIGVNSYLFGITSSGYLIFHNKFRPQYMNMIKRFYQNVDISDVEISSDVNITNIANNYISQSANIVSLRTAMLNQLPTKGVNKAIVMTTFQIFDSFVTGFNVTRNYYIAGITGTPYKFGLTIPTNQTIPIFTNKNFSTIDLNLFQSIFGTSFATLNKNCDVIYSNSSQGGISLKEYEFCYISQDIAALQMTSAFCTLINVFVNNTLLQQCAINSPDSLVYLANIYSEIVQTIHFNNNWANINGLSFYVQQIFSMHHFGLIRYYNYGHLSYQNFITNHSSVIDDPLYQETILTAQYFNNDRILMVRSLPNRIFLNVNFISSLIFTVTTPLVTNGTYIGIIGVQARLLDFQLIFMKNAPCNNIFLSECYVITESGVILLNNQNISLNGLSLKNVNCGLMESLVKKNIFFEQYFYDMQGLCALNTTTKNFSTRLIDPITNLLRYLLWFVYELLIVMQNLSFTALMWCFTLQEDNPSYNVSSVNNSRSCYLKIPAVMVKPFSSQLNGSLGCSNCNLPWFIRPINNTNLFLLVLMKSSSMCTCKCSSSFGNTIELIRNTNVPIENAYKVDPNFYSSFVTFNKIENSSICTNGCKSVHAPVRLMIIIFITLLLQSDYK